MNQWLRPYEAIFDWMKSWLDLEEKSAIVNKLMKNVAFNQNRKEYQNIACLFFIWGITWIEFIIDYPKWAFLWLLSFLVARGIDKGIDKVGIFFCRVGFR